MSQGDIFLFLDSVAQILFADIVAKNKRGLIYQPLAQWSLQMLAAPQERRHGAEHRSAK